MLGTHVDFVKYLMFKVIGAYLLCIFLYKFAQTLFSRLSDRQMLTFNFPVIVRVTMICLLYTSADISPYVDSVVVPVNGHNNVFDYCEYAPAITRHSITV